MFLLTYLLSMDLIIGNNAFFLAAHFTLLHVHVSQDA